ncbi:MAG: efflux RND transporter permease subunit [Gemmatimonadaceae bacterium]|nr:efflux RND transporter permease subunit [Gemmatimonadaceae bacterium]
MKVTDAVKTQTHHQSRPAAAAGGKRERAASGAGAAAGRSSGRAGGPGHQRAGQDAPFACRARLNGPQDFIQLVVAERGGNVVRLGDVATRSTTAPKKQRTIALYNGKDAVGVEIKKTSEYSTSAVAKRDLEKGRATPTPALPAGAQIKVVKNKGGCVEIRCRNVRRR